MARGAVFLALALLAAPAGLARAQDFVPCTIIDYQLGPSARLTGSFHLRFEAGRVADVMIRGESGTETHSLLAPLRPGLSTRQILRPWPQDPNHWSATFNLVTVEPAGTALLETWVSASTLPDHPQYTWVRLACGPKS